MKQLFVAISLVFALILNGCVSRVNMKTYNSSSPKRIGVVIGHDIKAVSELTTGEVILYGALGGAIGASMAAENANKWKLAFENDITNSIWKKIQKDMQNKNYAVQLYRIKSKEWKFFENTSDSKEVYPKLVNYYQLDEKTKDYDAILFVEVLIEGRLMGAEKIEDLKAENMRMKYAKSKLFLYDTANGQRIFYDMIQRGYPVWSKVKLSEAIDTLVALEPLPATAIQ